MNIESSPIARVQFDHFKAFEKYTVTLRDFNIFVGPNNAGKSTLLNSFRVLAAGIRVANSRNATPVEGPDGPTWGHRVPINDIPMSFENVQTDYDKSRGASITFHFSSENRIVLYFSPEGGCVLVPISDVRPIKTPAIFRATFPVSIYAVPVLGPLEHEEQVVADETVKRNLATHRASRHFRNYWKNYPNNFEEFSDLVNETWAGMRILPPERAGFDKLAMFVEEQGVPRELYWAGFGFQVWCQLLTHIVRARGSSVLIVDEPEIYLHPDLQRQLLYILREYEGTVLLATHSPEIIAVAEPDDVVVIDKSLRNSRRLKNSEGVQGAIDLLGSSQNIVLAKLARTNRLLFVEGKDFSILSEFARVLGLTDLANQTSFAVIPIGGFSQWRRIEALQWGIKQITGQAPKMAVILDRDFRCDEEVLDIGRVLEENIDLVHFHQRKEIENYLLLLPMIEKALGKKVGKGKSESFDLGSFIDSYTSKNRSILLSQYIAARQEYFERSKSHQSTIARSAIEIFDEKWSNIDSRLGIVSGKDLLSALNKVVQDSFGKSLTKSSIIKEFNRYSVPSDLAGFLRQFDRLLKSPD